MTQLFSSPYCFIWFYKEQITVKPTLNLKYIQAIFILHVFFLYKTILIHKQTLLNTSLSNYPASVHLIHFFQIIIFLTLKSSCKRNERCCYNSKITRYPFFFFFVLPKILSLIHFTSDISHWICISPTENYANAIVTCAKYSFLCIYSI